MCAPSVFLPGVCEGDFREPIVNVSIPYISSAYEPNGSTTLIPSNFRKSRSWLRIVFTSY